MNRLFSFLVVMLFAFTAYAQAPFTHYQPLQPSQGYSDSYQSPSTSPFTYYDPLPDYRPAPRPQSKTYNLTGYYCSGNNWYSMPIKVTVTGDRAILSAYKDGNNWLEDISNNSEWAIAYRGIGYNKDNKSGKIFNFLKYFILKDFNIVINSFQSKLNDIVERNPEAEMIANNRICKYLLDSYHEANDKRNEYENKAKQFTQKLIDYYYNADANQPSKGYIIGQRIYNNLEKAQNNLNPEDGMLFSVLDINLYDWGCIDVDDSEEKQ